MFRFLLSKGLDVNASSDMGTPLQWVAQQCRHNLKVLLDHGANPNIFVNLLPSPSMWTLLKKSLPCTKLLIQAGASDIGVCYEMLDDNEMDPKTCLKPSRRIQILLGVNDANIEQLAQSYTAANDWVEKNIRSYWPDVHFRYIAMGNEAIPSSYASFVLPTIKNLHSALSYDSKRWRYLWRSVPSLNFNSRLWRLPNKGEWDIRKEGFMEFVEKTLSLHDGFNVDKFNMYYYNPSDTCARNHEWIALAVSRHVQHLCLGHITLLPAWLLGQVTTLELRSVRIPNQFEYQFPVFLHLISLTFDILSRHEVILETVGSLLSLLRTGDREAFRQFFLDGMLLVEDLLYVASISCGTSSGKASAKVSLKCFSESFNGIIYSPHLFSDLPECCRPKDGPGILIDITDKPRWQLFATWTIKIMSKCLTEGTLYVEGLINASFVSSACALLCYGDATLHMSGGPGDWRVSITLLCVLKLEVCNIECLAGVAGRIDDRSERLNAVYDSSMGACLAPLHSSCSDDVVELTATDLISVFSQSLLSTDSLELKVAMCNAYIRVAKTCPPQIWHPELLFTLLSSSPCYPLIGCIQVTIDMLGPNLVGQRVMDYCIDGLSKSSTKIIESLKLGEKRMAQNLDSLKSKRQKIGEEVFISTADPRKKSEFPCLYTFEKDKDYVDYIGGSLLSFVGLLKPGIAEANHLKPETALTALSMLSLAFCNYPPTDLSLCIFQQMHAWMPLICKQAEKSSSITFDISNYLKAFHSILHLQSSLPLDRRFLQIKRNDASSVSMMLKIPWTHSLVAIPAVSLCMTKSSSIGYLACLYGSFDESSCELYLHGTCEKQSQALDLLSEGFWCPKCDKRSGRDLDKCQKVLCLPDIRSMVDGSTCHLEKIQNLFFNLLYDESSEEVQLACVETLPRVLMHGTEDILLKSRKQWIQCIEVLLLHKKKNIREAFCTQISCFLEVPILNGLFGDDEALEKTKEQRFLDILKHALGGAQDPQIYETLLESIAEIMNVRDYHGQLFFYSLILLVDQLDSPHIIVRMTASRLIHRSCHYHLKGGLDLLISKVVHVRNDLFDYLCARVVSRPAMIREFAEAVLGIETEELVKNMVPVVLPKLVVSQHDNDQAFITIQELAKHLNMEIVPLIVNWLPKVLAFVLLRANKQEELSALQFYQVQTGSDNQEIFGAALPALLDELICFLDDGDSDETNERLKRVPQMIQEVAKKLTDCNDLPGFLRNHFFGLLNSIDRKMLHAEDLMLQKQALKRIMMLIEMMGSHLATYVPKIMVLLMHSIKKETLQIEALSVLHFFIKQLVKVSPSSTKHVISQVFAALIPFLERYKENSSIHLNKVVEILEELVVKNLSLLKLNIRELPLLPSIPVLHRVNDVIQKVRGSMTLRDQLRDVDDGLNHESLNVRYMVACELSKLLNVRREDVTTLILGEGASDLDILSSLITSLLRGCSEESRTAVGQRLKLVCADCLGALGAVDPAKVKGVPCQRFKIECSDDDLIFELIHKHLARAFRAAPDTIIQDSAALAIQELLKIAECQASLDESVTASSSQSWKGKEAVKNLSSGSGNVDDNSKINRRGQRLWDRFSNYVKEIIAPCLTSRFQLPNVADSTSLGPIYRPSMSLRRWIYFWIRKLTIHATGSRASIFIACRGIVRHDMQTATYLLPYLVLNAVCHSTAEARHGITEEILCVLNAAASENSAATVPGIIGGHSEVCIQAVFTLLDNLGQWVDDVKQEVALSKSLQSAVSKHQLSKAKGQTMDLLTGPDQLLLQCSNVSELLSAIPKVTLARASFRCQAFARSLLYFESHVLAKSGSFNPAAEKSGIFDNEDVSFLMELYSGLDEPDGLSGLAHLRRSSSLHDQLLINKKAGNWASPNFM
ncbi:hypothetical protein IFM89_020374 [Coptis chinensis]|uniref:non-specific serine/threonine protein kinase n=1 Tax=Coptis chinensis TaxID=261450 RepID=A0A835HKY7_9MAGN|nr:hypothetical protein IFM89_020374 [Coptis chinensis]